MTIPAAVPAALAPLIATPCAHLEAFPRHCAEALGEIAWLPAIALLLLTAGIVGYWRSASHHSQCTAGIDCLSPYAVAFLSGGPERALDAALISLVQRGMVRILAEEDRIIRLPLTPPSDCAPAERFLYYRLSLLGEPWTRSRARIRLTPLIVGLPSGLMIAPGAPTFFYGCWLGAIWMLGLQFAISQNLEDLAWASVACLVGAALVRARSRWKRTANGNDALAELQRRHIRLAGQLDFTAEASARELPLAVALYGRECLQRTPLAWLVEFLTPASRDGHWRVDAAAAGYSRGAAHDRHTGRTNKKPAP